MNSSLVHGFRQARGTRKDFQRLPNTVCCWCWLCDHSSSYNHHRHERVISGERERSAVSGEVPRKVQTARRQNVGRSVIGATPDMDHAKPTPGLTTFRLLPDDEVLGLRSMSLLIVTSSQRGAAVRS